MRFDFFAKIGWEINDIGRGGGGGQNGPLKRAALSSNVGMVGPSVTRLCSLLLTKENLFTSIEPEGTQGQGHFY